MRRSLEFRINLLGIALAAVAGSWLVVTAPVSSHDSGTARFNVREIDSGAAKQLMDAGAVFIDVRGREAFAGEHISGALAIPLEELRGVIPTSATIDRTQPIVIYGGAASALGPEGVSLLADAGYSGAVNLKGGIESWHSAGLPIEKSVELALAKADSASNQ